MGYFKRTIAFPVSVNVSETTFSCQNGILEIKLPKDTKNCSLP
ncbi:MAG: Hsp20/alpha crystallin family protein [Deltaproteobacteria bacterium]|nr:Hsp20/alpha crystallin family protein [Deltaproteobacteria bacterium]